MRTLPVGAPEAVLEATHALDRGELVILPADGVYRAAADALEEATVLRLVEACGTEAPLTVGVGALEEVRHVARLTPAARRLWPEDTATLLLPAFDHLPGTVTAGRPAVPVRLLRDPFARALASHFGPIALSWGTPPPPTRVAEAVRALPAASLAIDAGDLPGGSERVVDATGTAAPPAGGPERGRQTS